MWEGGGGSGCPLWAVWVVEAEGWRLVARGVDSCRDRCVVAVGEDGCADVGGEVGAEEDGSDACGRDVERSFVWLANGR